MRCTGRDVVAFLIVLLSLVTPAPQSGCKPQFAALDTGSSGSVSPLPFWRKSEAGDWGGTGWLGWTYRSRALLPVRFVVRDLPRTSVQDDEEVTVESIPTVPFAVRCVPGLRAGPIADAGVMDETLHPNSPLKISLAQRQYEIHVQSARDDLFDAKVVLTDGQRTQVLYAVPGFADEPHFDIVWAGDLDRDGKLDLVVNLNAKYSLHPYRLLLSSLAPGGDLVGQAAVFEISN